jgi:hypothetical protein
MVVQLFFAIFPHLMKMLFSWVVEQKPVNEIADDEVFEAHHQSRHCSRNQEPAISQAKMCFLPKCHSSALDGPLLWFTGRERFVLSRLDRSPIDFN